MIVAVRECAVLQVHCECKEMVGEAVEGWMIEEVHEG